MRKREIIQYMTDGEKEKREIVERRTVPCGLLVGGLAVEEITALIGRKSSVAGG